MTRHFRLRAIRMIHILLATVFVATAYPGATLAQPPASARGLPEAAYYTDQIIIKFKPRAGVKTAMAMGSSMAHTLSAQAGVGIEAKRSMSGGAHVYRVTTGSAHVSQVKAAAQRLMQQNPNIEYAEPDYRMFPAAAFAGTPNDTRYGDMWGLKDPTTQTTSPMGGAQGGGGANLPGAWAVTTGDAGIVVAVLDTGILAGHEDLTGRTVAGYDFISDLPTANDGDGRDNDPSDPGDWDCVGCSSSWHGTHVAGTIGASANNAKGVTGINWVSKLQALRVLGVGGGTTSDIADAIRWGAGLTTSDGATPWPQGTNPTPAKVLNMSLGGGGSCSITAQNAIDAAVGNGAVVVVSAGNDNSGLTAAPKEPATCSNVLTVAALAPDGGRAWYSNYDDGVTKYVTIAAPGGDTKAPFGGSGGILSTLDGGTTSPINDNAYVAYQGTSMAAPHVTGVVSLMLSANPTLTPAQVKTILISSARSFTTYGRSDCTAATCGAGMLDAAAAVNLAANFTDASPATPPTLSSVTATATGPTTANLAGTSSEIGTGYWVVLPGAGAAVPSAAQVKAGQNASGGAALQTGNAVMLANTAKTFAVSGLTASTSYTLCLMAEDATGNASTVLCNNVTTNGDVTPPSLSTVTATATGQTTANLAGTSNEAATGYWVVLAGSSAIAPTSAQVKAGQNASGGAALQTGNAVMLANTAKTFSVSGLTAATSYTLCLMAEDTGGNQSAVTCKVVTTDAMPTLSSVSAIANGDRIAQLIATSNKDAFGYWVALPGLGAPIPSAAQVNAGQDSTGAPALLSGDELMTAATAHTFNVSVLTASTSYTLCLMAEDLSGIRSVVTCTGVTTSATPDSTPPTLSNVRATATGLTTVSLVATSNESGRVYWVALPGPSATPPSEGQVLSGQDSSGAAAVRSGNQTVTAATEATYAITGLTASTPYTLCLVASDSMSNLSTVACTEVTTNATADVTAPTLSNVSATATGQTTLSVVGTSNESATGYWVVLPGPAAPTPGAAQVKAGKNAANAAALLAANAPMPAATVKTLSFTGLAASMPYTVCLMAEDASGNQSTVTCSEVTTSATADTTAPTLSSVSATATSQTTVNLAGTSNEAATGYWVVLAGPGAAVPTAVQVKSGSSSTGTAALLTGNATMVAATAKTFGITGLTTATPYTVCLMAEDASGNQSTVTCKDVTTNATADTTAPTLSAVTATATGQTTANLAGTSNEAATGYWVVLAGSSATAPTAVQVKAGKDSSGAAALFIGSAAMTAATTKTFGITGLTASTSYTVCLMAEDASSNQSTVACSNVTTLAAPPAAPAPAPAPAPTGPIPSLGGQPYVPGIGNQPGVLNLSGGDGPAMTSCLMATLGQALGGNPVYQGQNANGGALVAWNGQLIVFYPLSASTGSGQGAGVNLQNGNTLNVVTGCGAFSVSPALADLAGIGAILNGMGLNANINGQGVITVLVNGTYYVVRPDYLVTPGTPGAPSLVMGADGLFHYTDSNGNSQILRPAFLDTDTLQNQLFLALGGGSMVIQADGTALLSFGGHQYVLTPDLTLGAVPQAHAMDYWWQDGPNHYSVRINVYAFSALSQGFTIRQVN